MSAAGRSKRVVAADWPELPYQDWGGTVATLHRWLQIAGKIRMQLSPWVNHSWSTTLYVTARGLTTSPMPFGSLDVQIDFDFIDHVLLISTSDGRARRMELRSRTVADFYTELFRNLSDLGIDVTIYPAPNEVPDPIPFPEDTTHSTYEHAHAAALWQAFRNTARVMGEFRARFLGKVSPIHLFWGAPDLAVTRFSGRPAPKHKGGIPHLPDAITHDAYSQEVSSCGFWPGNAEAPEPSFYAYAYPTPDGFSEATVEPYSAFWHKDLGEFVLPYSAVRASETPDETLQRFFQTTYEAAANLTGWDREKLEQPLGFRPIPRTTS